MTALKILFLNHNVAWSGTFFRGYHLGRELVRRGHDVTLVTTHRSRRFGTRVSDREGLRIVEAPDLWAGPARNGFDPWNAASRMWFLRSFDCDLIHAFDSRPTVIGPALAVRRRTGARLVLDWADWWGRGGTIQERSGWLVRTLVGPIETWFEETFRNRADGTTVISTALGERALALGVRPDRLLCFPQGCDTDGLRPTLQPVARQRLGLPAASRILVHLGALFPNDGQLLFEMLRVARMQEPELQLVLVGNPRVPPPADLVATGAVRLTGFIDFPQVSDWLAAADLCVIPLGNSVANRGRWPSKINDYLAAGRPTVIPDVGDAAKLVTEHRAGWVTSPTPSSFAQACVDALGRPEERLSAGLRARQVAEKVLRWSILTDRVETFYKALV